MSRPKSLFSFASRAACLIAFWLAGCSRVQARPPSLPTPVIPTHAAAATPAAATGSTPVYANAVAGATAILEVSDPASPTYDIHSNDYAQFPLALAKLALLDSPENNAASMLAYAITFPRLDSYLAAQFLISLGPAVDGTTVGQLLPSLKDQRPRARLYTVLVIGNAGNQASCALGQVAPLLWDSDPYVRSATAQAIVNITGRALLPDGYQFTPQPLADNPVPPDLPPGSLSNPARAWWNEHGSKINWHPSYDLCDP
ncbi:MAG TPA: hypothetical protein VMT91_03650 [Anaerolineales bacterium]|nr:hypothetical protein [Anaerolineales bacterium]